MAYEIPTFSEAKSFLIALGKALFPDRNYGNTKSYHSRRAAFLAGAQTQLHAQIASVEDDVMVDTAGDDGPIDRWGAIYDVIRKAATPARGTEVGRVRGAAATAVQLGEELTHPPSGLRYKVGRAMTVAGTEYVDVDIVAIDTGARTKLDAGQTLRFVSTPAGLESDVVLQAALDDDGLDDEPFGAYRARVLAAISEPTAGGTQADYVRWMLELEGVTSAYAYGGRAGLGTVDLVGLHTGQGADRALDSDEELELLAHVRELAPIQVAGANSEGDGPLRALTIVPEETDVEILVEDTGESAYAFDWTSSVAVTVLLATSATRTIQLTAARPATMKAGHRVVFKGIASAQDGTEYTIEALDGSDSFILEAWPTVDPVNTDLVYSGGPLTTPIRDAIVAHMNGETVYAGRNRIPLAESTLASTVGLEILTTGIGPANPANAYGTWQGGLLLKVLGQIVQYKRGVRTHTISTPAADVEATDYAFPDDDTQIGLITPGSILIRSA